MRHNNIFFSLILISCATACAVGQPLPLDTCLNRALRNNAAVQNTQLDIARAKSVKNDAMTNYFPKVSGSVIGYYAHNPLIEYTIDDIDNAYAREWLHNFYAETGYALGLPDAVTLAERGVSVGVTAVQPVFMGGKIVNGNRLAAQGVKAAELQHSLSCQQLLLQTEQSYWLAFSLIEKKETVGQALELLDTLYRDVDLAVQSGLATSNDLLKVTLKRNELLSDQLRLDNGIVLAMQALCQMAGIPYSDSLTLADTLPDNMPLPETLYRNTDEAVLDRDESRLLNISVQAEQLKRKMTVAEALPQLMVGVNASAGNLIFDNFKFNTVGFLWLKIPITDWWSTGCKMRQHNLDIQKAENTRRDLTEKMSLETQQAWNGLQESRQQLQLSMETVEYARQNLASVQVNYDAGIVAIHDLLEAQTLLRQAIDKRTEARINYRMQLRKYAVLTGK